MRDLLGRETQDVRAAEVVALFCYGMFMDEEQMIVRSVCSALGFG